VCRAGGEVNDQWLSLETRQRTQSREIQSKKDIRTQEAQDRHGVAESPADGSNQTETFYWPLPELRVSFPDWGVL